jgi:hypothetical protein
VPKFEACEVLCESKCNSFAQPVMGLVVDYTGREGLFTLSFPLIYKMRNINLS